MGSLLTAASLDRFAAAPFPAPYSTTRRDFFAGVDDVHGVLKLVIASATHSLALNMFGYDDDELDAQIRKHVDDPGVFVQMSLDRSQAGGVHEKALLAKWQPAAMSRIAIGTSEHSAISHLKLGIVDGYIVFDGSTNWSASGEQKQDNQLSVSFDALYAARARTRLDRIHEVMLRQMAARGELGPGQKGGPVT